MTLLPANDASRAVRIELRAEQPLQHAFLLNDLEAGNPGHQSRDVRDRECADVTHVCGRTPYIGRSAAMHRTITLVPLHPPHRYRHFVRRWVARIIRFDIFDTGSAQGAAIPWRFAGATPGFPAAVRHDLGYQLYRLQIGKQPLDFKPMSSIGMGVEELRMRGPAGIHRVIYTARLPEAIHVLHIFQKKTRATSRLDIELARARYSTLMKERR